MNLLKYVERISNEKLSKKKTIKLKTDYKAICQVHNFVNKSMHMFTWKNIRKTFPKKPSIYLV